MKASYRILNVNGDETTRYAVSRILGECGWEITEATSGRAALAKVRSERPDLLVVDVKLPDGSGPAACSRLQAAPLTVALPVVLLSSICTDDETKADGLSRGGVELPDVAHHGALRFETEAGEFTRFHLELPVGNGRELGGNSGDRATAG